VLELALQLSATFITWSKPEVYLHHNPYFRTETLAIILKLFSILYRCYYSQNYSSIIIAGLDQIAFGKVAECDWIFITSLLDNQYIYIYIYKYLTHMNQPEMYGTSNALNNDHQLQETYMI